MEHKKYRLNHLNFGSTPLIKRRFSLLFVGVFALNQMAFAKTDAFGANSSGRITQPVPGSVDQFGANESGRITPQGGNGGSGGGGSGGSGAAAGSGLAPQISEFTVNFAGGSQYTFQKTFDQFQKLYQGSTTHTGVTCSKGAADSASIMGISLSTATNESQVQGAQAEQQAAQSAQQAGAFQATCSAENEKLLADATAVQATLNSEKSQCYQFATQDAIQLATKSCTGATIAYAACYEPTLQTTEQGNKQMCDQVKLKVEQKDNAVMAWLKSHWAEMLGILGLLGAGLMALNSSGKNSKDDFTTKPNHTPSATPTPSPTATPSDNPSPSPTASDTPKTPTTPQFCGTNLKPLECFVTPGCDLKCVSDKYGVPNYTGMANDTTRIDSQGNAVDSTSALNNANPGSNTASGGGGGSGKGGSNGNVANLSATSESGTLGDGPNTRSIGDSGFNDESGSGRGGGVGSDSDRDPASDGRYNNQGKFSSAAALRKDPAANGPILPPTANLFQRIWNVSRAQCVRDLVLCGGR